MKTNVIICLMLALCLCLIFSCQKQEIKVAKSLDGTWVINEITHFTDDSMTTIENTFNEPIGEISFEFCNFHKEGESCDGSVTFSDGQIYGITHHTTDFFDSDDDFGVEVGIDADRNENVTVNYTNRPLSITDTWFIEEHSENNLTFTFESINIEKARVKCTRK